jgi:hypothetical protein
VAIPGVQCVLYSICNNDGVFFDEVEKQQKKKDLELVQNTTYKTAIYTECFFCFLKNENIVYKIYMIQEERGCHNYSTTSSVLVKVRIVKYD